jgi:REP element-mobilizing transposase RayT
MPRLARLDIAGLLQHVIVRGIEQRNIFNDDQDRQFFVERFALLLRETEVRCYAWALLSNHLHMLLMPTAKPLAHFMRRLLTGYAMYFNRRNKRAGHLFQNRYKAIVCEEEPYLLELVRYIHLNPLRAGMVAGMDELDVYPWCGHAVLLGKQQVDIQDTAAILERFGRKVGPARQNYRQFVADGVKAGRRDELVGGGLRRSQGERQNCEYESFDERVLGSGDFVDSLKRDFRLREKMARIVSLSQLLTIVAEALMVDPALVMRPSKSRAPAAARGVICYLAVYEFGYTGSDVGQFLRLGSTGVSLASRRGEKLLKGDSELFKAIKDAIDK